MTKQELLDLLADERDRLADEADGLALAHEAGCSPALLAALLVPVVGLVIAQTARAACMLMNTGQIENRIAKLRQLVLDVEALAERVVEASPEQMPAVEQEVLRAYSALREVSALDELADAAIDGARGAIDSVNSLLGGVGSALGFIFSPLGALAVLGTAYFVTRPRRA